MILTLPLRVAISADKSFILNLNNYRNAHHFTLNKAKKLYTLFVIEQLPAGNRALFHISVLDAEHAGKLALSKKKHKDNPALHSLVATKMKNQHEHTREILVAKAEGLKTIRITKQVYLHFTYHHGNRGKIDTANPCSIIDKFACDALTAAGIWPDDDSKTIKLTRYEPGSPDKSNPRCELRILLAPNQDIVNNQLFKIQQLIRNYT